MKIIFLDIDGVLVTRKSMIAANSFEAFDAQCVECLNQILSQSNAKVVVSSSWRIGRSIENLQSLLTKEGISCEVIDRTVDLYVKPRGHEIKAWLDENHVESFVILDDDTDMVFPELITRQVVSTFTDGLLPEHVGQALEILNKPL